MTQNLTNVPVRRVQETVPSLTKKGEVYVFNGPTIKFFEAYTQSMDVEAAALAAGIDTRHRNEFLSNPYVIAEIDKIQRAWSLSHRMTVGFAAGEHMRLMEKFEGQFDKEKGKVKSSYAGTLAKMSEAVMKGVGLIGADNAPTVPNVSIELNLGGKVEVINLKDVSSEK